MKWETVNVKSKCEKNCKTFLITIDKGIYV